MSITRIESLCRDLEEIKRDCLGEEQATKKKKVKDDFFGLKEQVTVGLNDLAKSIAERNHIVEQYGRNRQAVKLNMENQKRMDVLKDQWNNMKKFVDKEKNKGKGILGTKLTDEELKQREDTLVLLETLIRDMEAMFYKEKSGRNDNNRLASRAKAELDAEKNAARASSGKGGKGGKGGNTDDKDGVELQELSADQQAFLQQVEDRDMQVDAKLELVLQGVRQLRQIGEEIHNEIETQGVILKEIDVKVDKTTKKFVFANRKMKELLEETGGLTRWCPIIIFVMVLLALAGYIMTSVGSK